MPHFDLAHMHISGLLERLPYNIYGKKIDIQSLLNGPCHTQSHTHVIFAVNCVYKFGGCYQFVERADM